MSDIDFTDPLTYVDGFPHEIFTELRNSGPMHRQEHEQWGHYWSALCQDEVRQVSRDSDVFTSQPNPFWGDADDDNGTSGLLISLDPPDHTRMRMLVSKGFTPRRVRELEERIVGHVDRLIDAVIDRGSCDMVADLAGELPMQVIAELVGVPPEDRHQIFEWTEQSFGFDPTLSDEQRGEAVTNMFLYTDELCRARQEDPQDDLISVLIDADIDGEQLTMFQIETFFLLLQNAGSETTRNLITTGMVALLDHPEQLAWLREDVGARLPNAIEELLRWTSPVMSFSRKAKVDTVVGGQAVGAGEHVVLWYPSANRDAATFDRPFQLDLSRETNDHVAFGAGGPHFCLGASLARMEGRIMFEALLSRFEGLRVEAPTDRLERVHSNLIDGYAKVPIAWDAVARKN